MRSRASWPRQSRGILWIIDGHNTIFADPTLENLQTGGDRREARRLLEAMSERFAATHGSKVVIVFDGDRSERNPAARRGDLVESQYSQPPEEADDRILHLAHSARHHGTKIAVVTSDRALRSRLPQGTSVVSARTFLQRLRVGERRRASSGPPEGDFSDIEDHFLQTAEESNDVPSGRLVTEDVPQEPRPTSARLDALERKRDRGRRRQRRRLESRKKGPKKKRK